MTLGDAKVGTTVVVTKIEGDGALSKPTTNSVSLVMMLSGQRISL